MPRDNLVGVPWGFGEGETNCVDLMYRYAGRQNPWQYNAEDYIAESQTIPERIRRVMVKVEDIQPGDVALVAIGGAYHVMTFIDREHILHVFEEQKSRISRYTTSYKKRTVGIFRWKEGWQWQGRQ